MNCTYSYPESYTVKTSFWTKSLPPAAGVEPPDLLNDTEYRDRVQYLRDKSCRLSLRDVRENDQSNYYFRFITDKEGGKYTGADGVYLSVAGLQVEVPERVREGEKVTLTCKTTCRLTDRTSFTWYKNGTTFSSSTEQLYLQSVSREDAGRYSCAVLDQNLHSPEVSLNVRYPPKSVSVSISPSGEIVEGSSVTLTCSSDGNPPVEYTWYKGSSSVATGKTFKLNKISSVNSGEYKCRSSNKHGEKYSDTVTLNVLYPPKSVSVSISPSGEIVEGSSVTLTCSSDGNPPVQKYTWFKKVDKDVQQKLTGQIYSITNIKSADSGEYQCMATNTQGSQSSEYKSLTVLYPPKSVSVSISPSGKIVEGSSVTLTCSSDGNPPVQKYTWFKGSSLVAKGENFTLNKISSVNSGEYKCKCINEHGVKYSDTVTLNVLYPPKSVSVSISPSGEIVEGSSVNLTCSSDGNPPVQNYTWFKEGGGSSPVGSGNSYTAVESGSYYCVAQNKYGSQTAAAVLVTLGGVQSSVVFTAVGVSAVCLLVVGVIFFVRRKRRGSSPDGADPRQASQLKHFIIPQYYYSL
ncbi:B-cell receptor CD22-like [Astyanax mexicanus]|uniref:B-cell receptor CD22-like n=1 Tax=Astyanax mexicanus TaxID=7994 RepID=UPI0020CB4010|nr:B-cell receptor CD22-like [Astyanax mexicanus]